MKITIETPRQGEEDEVIIRCSTMDEKLLNFISALKSEQGKLTGYAEDRIVKLSVKDIYYFESVDNKVFAYTAKETYEIHKKLYEIEQEFEHTDLLRISKSVIVNVSKIAYIKPMFNGRCGAKLRKEGKMIVSRQYVLDLKKKIGI